MKQIEIKKEHDYLKNVLKMIFEQSEELENKIYEKKSDIIKARQDMYENTARAISDFDDVVELSINNSVITEKTDDYHILFEQQRRLGELKITPYFGRVDFKDDKNETYNAFYIGKYSFYDKKALTYYIYDWRAPVSSLFYDYDVGEASFETPSGARKGNINLKRQYEISNGVIHYLNDTEALSKDEVFAKVLSGNTSKNLRVIIASIQKEQNKAIRYLKSRVLFVFGPAGSGKTSVGLHRLAYILYHNRAEISSKNIAVISNNSIFDSYISNIIPELGEDGINQFIFSVMIRPFIPKGYKEIDYYEQVNYLMNAHEKDTRLQGIKIKGSNEFLSFINDYFNDIKLVLSELTFKGEIVCEKEELTHLFSTSGQSKSYKELMSRLFHFIETAYKDYFRLKEKNIKKNIEKTSSNFLEPGQTHSIYQMLLHESIKNAKDEIVKNNNLYEISLYKQILEKYLSDKELNSDILKQTIENLDNKKLYHEDCVAVLCIKVFLNKIDAHSNIKHVLIDEAQDYSLLQLFFIKNLFSNSSFTVLADTNQAIHPFISTQEQESFSEIFKSDTKTLYLNKSYRSTGPINKLSFSLLDSSEDIMYFNRDGIMPSYIKTDDLKDTILEILKRHDSKTSLTGILTKTKQQAEIIYNGLKDNIDVQLIIDPSGQLQKNVIILPVVLAKGLEFDTVIADISTDKRGAWNEANILYLMSTRALHNLYLIGDSDLPEILYGVKSNIKIAAEMN